MKTIVVDANVILRFLLGDHPTLSNKARDMFQKAEKGRYRIYIDEVVVAECAWVLGSFYKIKREDIANRLEELIGQIWIVNARKTTILKALSCYRTSRLAYIDCWIETVSQSAGINLETFDQKLKKHFKIT